MSWRYGLLPRYPSVLRLVQFNCPDLLLGDLNNYVEERSRRNNFTRTDAIVEAITKYLDELGVLASHLEYNLTISQENKG